MLFLLGSFFLFEIVYSFRIGAIWRGPRTPVEECIVLKDSPGEFYKMIVFFALMMCTGYGGFVWMMIMGIRNRKKGD